MSTWAVPTLATAGAVGAATCPVCRRETTADMLDAVGAVARGVTGGAAYWCDGCRARAFATGAITRHDYYAALGAPTDVLAGITG